MLGDRVGDGGVGADSTGESERLRVNVGECGGENEGGDESISASDS